MSCVIFWWAGRAFVRFGTTCASMIIDVLIVRRNDVIEQVVLVAALLEKFLEDCGRMGSW